jgi:hypothetical protein
MVEVFRREWLAVDQQHKQRAQFVHILAAFHRGFHVALELTGTNRFAHAIYTSVEI